jgi:hypothetical protein
MPISASVDDPPDNMPSISEALRPASTMALRTAIDASARVDLSEPRL